MVAHEVIKPAKLKASDRVRFVSPASTPSKESVLQSAEHLRQEYGLIVEIGKHAFDEYGYLAGTDEDRLEDFNDAIRDPRLAAIFATCGGKGAYRIADGLDFAALRQHPKLFVGFSENTIIQMAMLKHCGLAALHGAPWSAAQFGESAMQSFHRCAFTTDPAIITSRSEEPTAQLTTNGRVSGVLIGGNQDMLATAAGWALPSFAGAILLLEGVSMWLGQIDRQLTMLQNSGALKGVVGVAIGQYVHCGSNDPTPHDWTAIDVLRDRLGKLNVPILGGLPIGHGEKPVAVPIGTMTTLDADAGTLTAEAGVR